MKKLAIATTILLSHIQLFAGVRSALYNEIKKYSKYRVGITILEFDTGKEIFSYNANRKLIPASNIKIVTTAAALEYLGAGYLFKTRFFVRGWINRKTSTLHGDIAIRGGGDPTFDGRFYDGDSSFIFKKWAKEIKKLGIKRVKGSLFLEWGFFDSQFIHPDWPKDQLHKWYQAPIASLSFMNNVALIKVRGRKIGRKAYIEVTPTNTNLRINNFVTTTRSSKYHRIAISRDRKTRSIRVWGRFYWRAEPMIIPVAIYNPITFFGNSLINDWENEGLTVEGRIKPVFRLPSGVWREIYTHKSPLILALEITNKRSHNFYAEMILKTIAANYCGIGNWHNGRKLLEQFLVERVGISKNSFNIRDGSGMSKKNKLTAKSIAETLYHVIRSKNGKLFLSLLPRNGEIDTTLQKRLKEPPYKYRVLGKTGTLGGVSSLSGVAKSLSGKRYIFAIIINGAPTWRGKVIEDKILRILIEKG